MGETPLCLLEDGAELRRSVLDRRGRHVCAELSRLRGADTTDGRTGVVGENPGGRLANARCLEREVVDLEYGIHCPSIYGARYVIVGARGEALCRG